jgi:dTMP kinase
MKSENTSFRKESTRLIVIEGIDGSGTTTQVGLLVNWMNRRGIKGTHTAEPSSGPVGLLLRQILTGRVVACEPDGVNTPIDNDMIALLFAADRLDHLQCKILPELKKGMNVISDRYYHSSLLYQSLDGDWDWILQLNSRARRPDVTYVLDIPAEIATKRRLSRASDEMYETESIQIKLADKYRLLPGLLPEESIVLVDGCTDTTKVHDTIVSDLCSRFSW